MTLGRDRERGLKGLGALLINEEDPDVEISKERLEVRVGKLGAP